MISQVFKSYTLIAVLGLLASVDVYAQNRCVIAVGGTPQKIEKLNIKQKAQDFLSKVGFKKNKILEDSNFEIRPSSLNDLGQIISNPKVLEYQQALRVATTNIAGENQYSTRVRDRTGQELFKLLSEELLQAGLEPAQGVFIPLAMKAETSGQRISVLKNEIESLHAKLAKPETTVSQAETIKAELVLKTNELRENIEIFGSSFKLYQYVLEKFAYLKSSLELKIVSENPSAENKIKNLEIESNIELIKRLTNNTGLTKTLIEQNPEVYGKEKLSIDQLDVLFTTYQDLLTVHLETAYKVEHQATLEQRTQFDSLITNAKRIFDLYMAMIPRGSQKFPGLIVSWVRDLSTSLFRSLDDLYLLKKNRPYLSNFSTSDGNYLAMKTIVLNAVANRDKTSDPSGIKTVSVFARSSGLTKAWDFFRKEAMDQTNNQSAANKNEEMFGSDLKWREVLIEAEKGRSNMLPDTVAEGIKNARREIKRNMILAPIAITLMLNVSAPNSDTSRVTWPEMLTSSPTQIYESAKSKFATLIKTKADLTDSQRTRLDSYNLEKQRLETIDAQLNQPMPERPSDAFIESRNELLNKKMESIKRLQTLREEAKLDNQELPE